MICKGEAKWSLNFSHAKWIHGPPPKKKDKNCSRRFIHHIQGPTKTPVQCIPGALSPMVSQNNHSPPSGAEVENEWSYTSTVPYVFMMRFLSTRENKLSSLPYFTNIPGLPTTRSRHLER